MASFICLVLRQGAYVVGAAPGEFKWQAGALTQAVAAGKWVVIEDVDLAGRD